MYLPTAGPSDDSAANPGVFTSYLHSPIVLGSDGATAASPDYVPRPSIGTEFSQATRAMRFAFVQRIRELITESFNGSKHANSPYGWATSGKYRDTVDLPRAAV